MWGWGVLSCVVDHIRRSLTRCFWPDSELQATPTQTKTQVKTTFRDRCLYSSFVHAYMPADLQNFNADPAIPFPCGSEFSSQQITKKYFVSGLKCCCLTIMLMLKKCSFDCFLKLIWNAFTLEKSAKYYGSDFILWKQNSTSFMSNGSIALASPAVRKKNCIVF